MLVENRTPAKQSNPAAKAKVMESIQRLSAWLEKNDYRGYDTFDGLSSWARPLTFNTILLRTVLQQGVRRFPINLRPVLGIPKARSTKGTAFIARGYMRLHDTTGNPEFRKKAEYCLEWLQEKMSPGYSGAAWGNHFDYQSRGFYLPAGEPTIVWTSLISHAFLDAYDRYGNETYLKVADSACVHIMKDLGHHKVGDAVYLDYIPRRCNPVHNASTLGASLLARVYSHTKDEAYRELSTKVIRYTADHQRADASWWYGEPENTRWVDNFHTAYVLDCFKYYMQSTGDDQFDASMMRGYDYWKKIFFLEDGTPRYYDRKTLPLDIQCSSQAIDTLVFFHDRDPDSLDLAVKVAMWTIENMQDPSGYFWYRRYNAGIVNKTPTLHWGQATMLCALAGLHQKL